MPPPAPSVNPAKATPSPLLQPYVAAVVSVAAILLIVGIPRAEFKSPLLFGLLMAGSMMAAVMKIHLPMASGQATLSMSYFTDFLSLVLLGPNEGMLVGGTSAATQCVVLRRGRFSLKQTLFSSSALIITIQAAGAVANSLGGFDLRGSFVELSRPAAAAAGTFFFCNSWLVATVVALSRRRAVSATWQEDFVWAGPACFVAAGAATFAASVMASQHGWLVLFAAALLGLTFHSYRIYFGRMSAHQQHVRTVSDLHMASVEALARAIDARDQTIDREGTAENHIRRVEARAAALGEAAGMSPHEIEGLKVAALLHDIGKLAVPEHILTKPGRLTPQEFDYIRIHPTVGAEIIKAVPFPYPVAPFIQSHHERWDGTGYPEGLEGEDIPLGARVLAVVDYHDALTAHRPYHRAMRQEEALETLRAEAGRALDPRLVHLFIEILPTVPEGRTPAEEPLRALPLQVRTGAPATGFSNELASLAAANSVFQSISQATQEMHALYDIAQTLGTRLSVDDMMGLLTSKLNRLIPASCWALYLPDGGRDVLRCRFASGLSAHELEGLRIPSGEGVTGWAARHHAAAINARASSDFEAAGVPRAGTHFQTALTYPLIEEGQLVGALTAYHVDPSPYTDAHRRLLDRVCGQVASVLRNSLLFERMRTASLTDSLTDLPNSRALVGHVDERLAAAAEPAAPSALIMMDVDDFKAINDVHGHSGGDRALQEVAGALRRHVRASDFCARYGGDEFVVAISCLDLDEANRRARDLQRAVGRLRVPMPNGESISVGISVGVAVSPEDGATFDELLAAADRRMYENKQQGRRSPVTVCATPSGIRLAHPRR
jgi:diguanylate cyclase (GGDEF)-like protein/putative nucleotidyltransferase with HDIG domain